MTNTDKDVYKIRTIFRRFYPDYLKANPGLSYERRKAAECIMKCKTGELGYNACICEKCGHPVIHAVSCNNRFCPSCQTPMEKKWEAERNTELIPGIAYYHVVFTIPHELNLLVRANPVLLLGLLFKAVNESVISLCADPQFMGAKPGIVSVLHTWGQTLSYHPHVHACISGGGLSPAGQFLETKHKGFFLPEAALASMFRGKYLCGLKKLYDAGNLDLSPDPSLANPSGWKQFIDSLFAKRWLPFVKETFNGKGNAIRYLARYSYRTAIANSRILSIDGEKVVFKYKDYSDGSKEKTMSMNGISFIGMFLQHVLPSGFHRIRLSGYLTNSQKTKNLKRIHFLRSTIFLGNPYRKMKMAELMKTLFSKDICHCPVCSATMIRLPRGMPLACVESYRAAFNLSE